MKPFSPAAPGTLALWVGRRVSLPTWRPFPSPNASRFFYFSYFWLKLSGVRLGLHGREREHSALPTPKHLSGVAGMMTDGISRSWAVGISESSLAGSPAGCPLWIPA